MSEPLYVHPATRRTTLKGLGASLTLPFLPSLAWATDRKLEDQLPPRRLATMIFANGVNEFHWTQEKSPDGGIGKVGSTLQPLVPYHDDLLYINDLHLFDETPGIHRLYWGLQTGSFWRTGLWHEMDDGLDARYLGVF